MTTDDREAIDRLDAYLDALAAGRPVPDNAVDPEWRVIDRQFRALDRAPTPPPAFAARLLEDLVPAHVRPSPRGPRSLPHANGRVSLPGWDAPPALPPSARRWVPAHLATAALLLLIVVGGFFAFGPGRPGRQGQLPAVLPVMSGTPEAQEPVVTETLLQATVAAMPAGAAGIWVNSYVMQPGAISPYDRVHGPVVRGSIVYTVEHGTVTITLGDTSRMLSAGDTWSVLTQTGSAIENTGSDEAHLVFVELIDTVASSGSGNANGPFIDGMSGSWDTWIEASPNLPGGPGQMVLQRVTLAPGAALPTYTESGLDWLGISAGRLTVRLEGERLPFRWKSGAERTFGVKQIPPVFPAGSRVTLRNANDDPLVLYRLTIAPSGATGSPAATPAP
jgi:hypothetical protein